ncbi:MAG TPA: hypothetical protein VFS20_31590 [Longimicrobium sp.]|nr:hypothetical protein [Longimicrobium sp.]
MSAQLITVNAIQRALSATRLSKYYRNEAGDGDVEAVARYLWNLALQAALVPALHAAELTIRNAVFDASVKVANLRGRRFNEIACWLDARPTLLYRNEAEAVDEAKDQLRSNPKSMTPGHLVAKLSFGFWVNLLNASYEQGRSNGPALWPAGLKEFHGIPGPERNRADMRLRFDTVRRFRNRVAHHEPIWDQAPEADYTYMLQTLRYLNPGMERAVAATCLFPTVMADGEKAYLETAERLLGQQRRAVTGISQGGAQ